MANKPRKDGDDGVIGESQPSGTSNDPTTPRLEIPTSPASLTPAATVVASPAPTPAVVVASRTPTAVASVYCIPLPDAAFP